MRPAAASSLVVLLTTAGLYMHQLKHIILADRLTFNYYVVSHCKNTKKYDVIWLQMNHKSAVMILKAS